MLINMWKFLDNPHCPYFLFCFHNWKASTLGQSHSPQMHYSNLSRALNTVLSSSLLISHSCYTKTFSNSQIPITISSFSLLPKIQFPPSLISWIPWIASPQEGSFTPLLLSQFSVPPHFLLLHLLQCPHLANFSCTLTHLHMALHDLHCSYLYTHLCLSHLTIT